MRSLGSRRVTACFVAAALLFSSTAAAAATGPVPSTAISPWAALSAFGTQASRASLCGAAGAAIAAAGAAAAAQAAPGQPGCVLPVVDAPPPVPVAEAAPVPIPPPPVAAPGGFGISPLVLALGGLALAGLIYLLAHNNEAGSPS